MPTQVAFLIRDLEPEDDKKDVVGIIAKVNYDNLALANLLDEINEAFDDEKLRHRYEQRCDVLITTGLEEVNGLLVGCVYLTGNGHSIIDDVAQVILERRRWTGTIATPAAVAVYIKQMEGFDCIDPTSDWKGFFNNEI